MPIAEYRLAICDRCGERQEVQAGMPHALEGWIALHISDAVPGRAVLSVNGLPPNGVLCSDCRRNLALWFGGSGVFRPPCAG